LKTRILAICLVLAMILTMTTMAASKVTTITYTRWAGTQEEKDFTELINKFMKANPDIQVKCEFLPWGSYWEKLRTTILGGTAADVISFSHLMSAPYVSRQVLYEMSKLPGAKALLNDMQEGTKAAVLVKGKIYGMPVGVGVRAMIYNKALFDKAGVPYPDSKKPMTWDQFVQMASKLTVKDSSGKVVQYATRLHVTEIWEAIVVQAGGKFVDDYTRPSKVTINTPEGIAGLQFLRTLVEKGIHPPWDLITEWEGAFGSPDSAVVTGKVAMMQSGPWALGPIVQKGINFGTCPLFMGKKRATRGYVNFLSISRNCKNPQAAWRLIRWMCDKGQLEFTKTGDLPANKKYLELAQKENPYPYPPEIMAAYFSELPYVITGPMVPTDDLGTLTDEVIQELVGLKITAAEAAKRLEQRGNEIIKNIDYNVE